MGQSLCFHDAAHTNAAHTPCHNQHGNNKLRTAAFAEAHVQWCHDGLQQLVEGLVYSGNVTFARDPRVSIDAVPEAAVVAINESFAASGRSFTTRGCLDSHCGSRYGTLIHYRARLFSIAFDVACQTRALIWLDLQTYTFYVFAVYNDHDLYVEHLDCLTCGMFEIMSHCGIIHLKG